MSATFALTSFISQGYNRGHVLFLSAILGWPLVRINLKAGPLQQLASTDLGGLAFDVPVLAPAEHGMPPETQRDIVSSCFPNGALVLLANPLKIEAPKPRFSSVVLAFPNLWEQLWLGPETTHLANTFEARDEELHIRQVVDTDNFAARGFAKAFFPKWQLEHWQDDDDEYPGRYLDL